MKKTILITSIFFTLSSSLLYAGALSSAFSDFSPDVVNYDNEITENLEKKTHINNSAITNRPGRETMKVNTSTSTHIKIVLKKEFDDKVKEIEERLKEIEKTPSNDNVVSNNTDLENRLKKIETYLKDTYKCVDVVSGTNGFAGSSTKTICGIGLGDVGMFNVPKAELQFK